MALSKTFTTMKTNVGRYVRDTSSSFGSLIGDWINDKYRDAWQRCLWSASINNDYTFESVAAQDEYNLPLDFSEELFVANVADGEMLTRYQTNRWWRDRYGAYQDDSIDDGTPKRYLILWEAIHTDGKGFGKLRLDPAPDEAETYAMPYKRKHTNLLGTTDTCTTDTANKIIASSATFITDGVEAGMIVKNTTDNTYGIVSSVDSETQLTMETDLCPDGDENIAVSNEIIIPDLEWIVEIGAASEAFFYKKQFQKGDYFNQRYETELQKRIMRERSHINQKYQRVSAGMRTFGIQRLTGDASYDTV